MPVTWQTRALFREGGPKTAAVIREHEPRKGLEIKADGRLTARTSAIIWLQISLLKFSTCRSTPCCDHTKALGKDDVFVTASRSCRVTQDFSIKMPAACLNGPWDLSQLSVGFVVRVFKYLPYITDSNQNEIRAWTTLCKLLVNISKGNKGYRNGVRFQTWQEFFCSLALPKWFWGPIT